MQQQRQAGVPLGILERNAKFLQTLSRCQEAGFVKTLAEPTLVTVSGRPATFHSGGAFPLPVPQDDGQFAIEFQEFGTRVDLVPLDLGNGKLRLEIRSVISESDPSRSVTVGEFKVPGLRVRTFNTTVEVNYGQTLAIGGIAQATPPGTCAKDADCKLASEETQLFVLVTPTLVGSNSRPVPPASTAGDSIATRIPEEPPD